MQHKLQRAAGPRQQVLNQTEIPYRDDLMGHPYIRACGRLPGRRLEQLEKWMCQILSGWTFTHHLTGFDIQFAFAHRIHVCGASFTPAR
ncbi:MAG TPA: hypothetical protein EYG03_27560 [Planctomycetes bacterium]|nr:hypothetical protein [Fuerstiella sp.]HIK95720.1 hypothetical protein [Planctomycetota bacterium]